MTVVERGIGLREEIDISVYKNSSFYEAVIRIINPTEKTVNYAHWINPQWAPGGQNELTDNTEFIIPTDQILIPERFKDNLGESPQDWNKSKLRFIKGWDKGWGDIMADGLKHGFYSAYSHDMQEGVVRVFDKEINPGVDIWTYGYHPRSPHGIPMGSGKENNGYVEIWGGTSKLYPDERHPISPGEVVEWKEWMYPYHKTGGLKYANKDISVNIVQDNITGELLLGICPSSPFEKIYCRIEDGNNIRFEKKLNIAPDKPYFEKIKIDGKVTGIMSLVHDTDTIAVIDIE
jgi:hypothetical protein